MATIRLRFPGGRYHATPWGHHVNEGLVEWPPSPWRLLRALLATGYTRLGWRDVPPIGVSLLEKLAGVLPRYVLPSATTGHSRHYMPAPVTTTLVFDTWACVGDGELAITWPVQLTTDESQLLDRLVGELGYLGRSESWVIGRVSDDASGIEGSCAFPDDGGESPGPGWEQVALLAPEIPALYAAWREKRVKEQEAALEASSKGKKLTAKARAKVAAPYPMDLIGCLGVDTAWLQGHGWSQPPGSRRVLYWRRADALEVGAVQVPPTAPRHARVRSVLLALATPTLGISALPSIVRTYPQARLLHKALARSCKALQVSSEATRSLLGKVNGERVDTGHQHAHLLPLDLDDDRHLDHILVWAPAGFDVEAQRVLRGVRKTYMKGGAGELQVTLVGMGDPADLVSQSGPLGVLARTVGPSVVWESATPFLPPRFLKPKGRNTLIGQVHAELASRGLRAREVVVLDREAHLEKRFRHFIVHDDRSRPPTEVGVALRIVLDAPHKGPLCLGYGSHYGLGRFEAH